MENLKFLKIYELYPKVHDQGYYAIHTLNQLYSDKDHLKDYHIKKLDETFDKIKSIKEFLSEFSLHPYLMLNNLGDKEKEKKVLDKIVYEIVPNFIFNYKPKEVIKKINPYESKSFIKNLLFTITNGENDKEFKNVLKAEKLFYLYADKKDFPLIMENLKSYSNSYRASSQARESLDD